MEADLPHRLEDIDDHVLLPDARTPAEHDEVVCGCFTNRGLQGLELVRHAAQEDGFSTRLQGDRGHRVGVDVVDLPRPDLLARRDHLVACRENRDAGLCIHIDVLLPDRRDGTDLRGGEELSRVHDALALPDVLPTS